ncbi:MAG: GMC family oxidoreductase [Acidimicrobiia bacterium]
MIIDAESVPSGEAIEADLCIVGAGPAGLTLARQFIGTQHRVYILESGGRALDGRALDLADGENRGDPYFPLSLARARVLGGSSYMWDEWVRARPLDRIDFQRRTWVADSGWPFGLETIEEFYPRAHEILGLGDFDYNVPVGRPFSGGLGHGDEVVPAVFRYSNTFDFEKLVREIDASSNVCLVLNGNVLELEPAPDGSAVRKVVVSSALPQKFRVAGRVFVLAAGGIDNARLLLASRSGSAKGLANSSGLVGSHFMEHPTMRRGRILQGKDVGSDQLGSVEQVAQDGIGLRVALAPSDALMERAGILNAMALITASTEAGTSEAFRSMAIVRDGLRGNNTSGEPAFGHLLGLVRHPMEAVRVLRARSGGSPDALQLSFTVEQAPGSGSKVGLSDELDAFGQPRAFLKWVVGDQERRTVRVFQDAIGRMLETSGLGRVDGLLGDEFPARRFRGEWHQLGTTRMAASPRQGVVDADCRSHDVPNLFVAGGSVFPTVGYANPTLTILALSLRLSGTLETALSREASLGPIW